MVTFGLQKRRERRLRDALEMLQHKLDEAQEASDAYLVRADRARAYGAHLLKEGRDEDARTEAKNVSYLSNTHRRFADLAISLERLLIAVQMHTIMEGTEAAVRSLGLEPSRVSELTRALSNAEHANATPDKDWSISHGATQASTASSDHAVVKETAHRARQEA